MRNTYNPWEELRLRSDITLEWIEMSDQLGEYNHWRHRIRLDPRMPARQQRSVLCHELRHAAVGDFLTHCGRVNLRQEQWADQGAARLLVDIHDLGDALALHDQHLSAAAVELDVSDELLKVRLRHLHPSERHALTRRLTGGDLTEELEREFVCSLVALAEAS